MNKLNYWQQRLKNEKIKWTKQRAAILATLLKADEPLSAQEIFKDLKTELSNVRLSTVYRNLNRFVDKELLLEFQFSKEKRFELNKDSHHHHLLCVSCEKILPLKCPLQEFEAKLKEETNYHILSHKMKMRGVCPDCQE